MEKERLAETYERHHATGERYGFSFEGRERGAFFSEHIGQGKRVLDLGCRDGELTRTFAEGNVVVGVDVDRDALARFKERLGAECLWHDLLEPLPFEDGAFDAVVTGEVLEHLSFPEKLLDEVQRVLGPGGVYTGSVPNAFRLKNRLSVLVGGPFDPDPTHLRQFTPGALGEMLRARFEDVRLEFRSSRFLWLWPRMMANEIFWVCRRAAKT
jgi:SAM-dependent methyltransferase